MGKTIPKTETSLRNSFRPSSRVERTPTSVTREILRVIGSRDMISFAGGLPDDSLFPLDELRYAFQRSVSEKRSSLFQYTDTQGHKDLRTWIAERYYPDSTEEEIILTSGSQQALDLIARYFLDSDSKILIERPSYLGAIQVFSSYSPEFIGIENGEDGPDPEALEYVLNESKEKPKFFYCVPDFQNPSGVSYSKNTRERVAELCGSHGVPIVEDIAYKELNFTGKKEIMLNRLAPENSVSIGTFSKILSPGLRVGWIRAPKEIIADLLVQKQAMDLHSPQINQELCFSFVSSPRFEEHLSRIREVYGRKCEETYSYFREIFDDGLLRIRKPEGGLFLWLEFSEAVDTDRLFHKGMDSGIAFVPGSSFYPKDPSHRNLRWNFSNASRETSREGIRRLRDAARKP